MNLINISNKGLNSNNILLVEGKEIVNDDGKIATTMSRYFTNITKHMNLNPLSANPEKWSNTLRQIVGNLPTICLSVFDHFRNLTLKGLRRTKSVTVKN